MPILYRLGLIACLLTGGACVAHATLVRPEASALATAAVPFPFTKWDALLHKYVDTEGRVNYGAIDRGAFEKVFAAVAASSPASKPAAYPTRQAREAYYLDAYNVLVWKNVLDRLPKLKSVDDEKVSFFFFTKFLVGDKKINLKDLEGDVIRPTFKDPRVHMALNCASGGCPMLPNEAFTPAKLDAQLDREARRFVSQKRNVDYDAAKNEVTLSKIFDWYKDDFGKEDAKVIGWIDRYRAAGAQVPTNSKIRYRDYDWRLNDLTLTR